MQVSFFYMMPSLFFSGFMIPFQGLPGWARVIGEVIPITHFLRIIRGSLLKGQVLADMGTDLCARGFPHRGGGIDRSPVANDPGLGK
jgi:ABC-2 type transport system permease protein